MQESLFAMFCMVYEYFLLTADNEDLYVRQYPFKLEQVLNCFFYGVQKLKRSITEPSWSLNRALIERY